MGDIHLCNSSFWTDQGNLQREPPSAALSVLAVVRRPSGRFFYLPVLEEECRLPPSGGSFDIFVFEK
ncbi:hypothetical protein, partial [Frigidibacter sp. MR17.24]|uniref:hypothetical protein n=1 Tax=Frigidibacter sp. MR17.24 TaxID=3127345 RepID=UPI003012BF42